MQVAATVAMLALTIGVLDRAEFRARLAEANMSWLVIGLVLLFVQQCIAAVRWRLIAVELHLPRSSMPFFLLWHGIGTTAGQVLPSTIGGDAVRAFALLNPKQLAPAVRSVLADRLVGMIVLSLLVVVGFALAPSIFARNYALLGALAFALAGIVVSILLTVLSAKLTSRNLVVRAVRTIGADLKGLAGAQSCGPVLAQSLTIHLLSVGAFIAFARAVGIADPDPIVFGSVICSALLASVLPISIGGWGLREGFVVITAGILGTSAEAAISVSVLFGTILILASIGVAAAGAILLTISRRRARKVRGGRAG
jgi:uncharacterized membrane protein YbhN (UPF0104 family)